MLWFFSSRTVGEVQLPQSHTNLMFPTQGAESERDKAQKKFRSNPDKFLCPLFPPVLNPQHDGEVGLTNKSYISWKLFHCSTVEHDYAMLGYSWPGDQSSYLQMATCFPLEKPTCAKDQPSL